jgi:hypothetical protein
MIDDPQKLARENNHLGRVFRMRGNVTMALGIFVQADGAGEEIGHRFLFAILLKGTLSRPGGSRAPRRGRHLPSSRRLTQPTVKRKYELKPSSHEGKLG